ncbi:SHOCT domain-containing protein [Shouchella clausii]|uniref:SHOCT domain-containing protein n=1 Tax=Shouchella clausii TaxID=79880 RepID=UPI0038736889
MEHTFKGQGSTLVVLEDKLILKHGRNKRFTSSPTVEIKYSDLDKLILQKPSIVSGYCYFLRKGFDIQDLSKLDIMADEYAITISFAHQFKRFLKAEKLINQYLDNIDQNDTPVVSFAHEKLLNELINGKTFSYDYSGLTGSIVISKSTITLKYKKFLHTGGKGSKTVDIQKISSVSVSKPTMTSGKVKIHYEGFANRGYYSPKEEANEITITNINQYNQMLEAKELILALKRYHENQVHSTDSLSPADEIRKYKSLFDEGIISEEEFEKKKKELLN